MEEITVEIINPQALERASKVFNSYLKDIAISIKSKKLNKENKLDKEGTYE